jgi:glycosyltransferase involved in cell wall biosynthesis
VRVGIDARKLADFGIGTYIRGLLGALVELGGGDEYVAFAPPGARLPDGVEHVVSDAPHYSVRELVSVGRAADRAGLDVFHAPHYVVPFTKVPVVVTIHDLIHLHQPQRNPAARIYARAMLGRAVKKARVVLTVTEAVKRQLVEELGARNVRVTPNGVSSGAAAAPAAGVSGEVGGRSDRHSTGDASNYFLYVGNDKPHKNVGTLVEAAKRANVRLVLVGAPFERFDGVEKRGFVSDGELSALYSGALALVLPSLEEGFGLPAAEAMAHGAAVITSLDPALVEITGDAALHADARDAGALAEAMRRVASDGALRAELGAKGRERARLFTWKRCAELTREVYEEARTRGTSWNVG